MMKKENGLSLKIKLLVLFAGIMFVMHITAWGVIVYLVTSLGPQFFFSVESAEQSSGGDREYAGRMPGAV